MSHNGKVEGPARCSFPDCSDEPTFIFDSTRDHPVAHGYPARGRACTLFPVPRGGWSRDAADAPGRTWRTIADRRVTRQIERVNLGKWSYMLRSAVKSAIRISLPCISMIPRFWKRDSMRLTVSSVMPR